MEEGGGGAGAGSRNVVRPNSRDLLAQTAVATGDGCRGVGNAGR